MMVFDIGSGTCRAGLATGGMEAYFPSIIGKSADGTSNSQVGDSTVTEPRFPVIDGGRIVDWVDLEKFFHYAYYNQMKRAPEEYPILLTEPALNPPDSRARTGQLMFETINAPAFYMANRAAMALVESERETGIVIKSGYGGTSIVPVYQGKPIKEAIIVSALSGQRLTAAMAGMLSGRADMSSADLSTYNYIKEKFTYLSMDPVVEINTPTPADCVIPDGRTISLTSERFRLPEALFQPSLFNLGGNGLHQDVYSSILRCDTTHHSILSQNIVLAGGNTMFPGLVARLQKELDSLIGISNVKVITSADPRNSSWNGATVFVRKSEMDSLWITRRDYEEVGPNLIDRRIYH